MARRAPSGLGVAAVSRVIDLSHHQPYVDFGLVRQAGVSAVIHKATQGTRFRDEALSRRRALCAKVGLMFGAYHFGTGDDPARQAEHFLRSTAPGDLLVLDVERDPSRPDKSMTLEQAESFAALVRAETGRAPMIYGAGDYLRDVLSPPITSSLGDGPLWWARWAERSVSARGLPACWAGWTLWQHTNGRTGAHPRECSGVGPCDNSIFNADERVLRGVWEGWARS